MLSLPVFTVIRQSLAALVPAAERRPAYSIDSMSVEVSYMVAPALGVFLATVISTTVALAVVGGGFVLAGVSLYLLNPPTRGEDDEAEAAAGGTVPWRAWMRPALIGVLVATAGATLVLVGTDVSMVAVLRGSGQVRWVGLVAAVWGLYSLIGGFVHGTERQFFTSGIHAETRALRFDESAGEPGQRPEPDVLDAVLGPSQAAGHVGEAQTLELSEDDDLAIVFRKPLQSIG